jgi:ribosomal protein S18 acetylase RimI-like enzyme
MQDLNAADPALTLAVTRLWRASFEHGTGIVDPHPIEGQHRHLVENVLPAMRVRVVMKGERPIAFMGSTAESIGHLYVAVSHVGRGLGTRFVEIAKAESVGHLWLYTFASNTNARRFYEHHGFVETERESENMWKREAIRYEWRRGTGEAR